MPYTQNHSLLPYPGVPDRGPRAVAKDSPSHTVCLVRHPSVADAGGHRPGFDDGKEDFGARGVPAGSLFVWISTLGESVEKS